VSRTIFAIALVLASYARAADDKPLVLLAGDPAPIAGVLLPVELATRRAQELSACRVEVPELRKAVLAAPAPWVVVVLVVAGIAAGGAAGYGIAKATQPKP
jgi:hypothetical protein